MASWVEASQFEDQSEDLRRSESLRRTDSSIRSSLEEALVFKPKPSNHATDLYPKLWAWKEKEGRFLSTKQLGAIRQTLTTKREPEPMDLEKFKKVFYESKAVADLAAGADHIHGDLIEALFEFFDVNHDGVLGGDGSTENVDEIVSQLAIFGSPDDDAQVASIFDAQAKGRGKIEREDVVAMIKRNLKMASDEVLSVEALKDLKVRKLTLETA